MPRRPRISSVLLVLIVLAALAGAVLAAGLAPRAAPGSPPPPERPLRTVTVPVGTGTQLSEAVQVLRDWDQRRAAAWRAGDVEALRDLYVSASSAARADVAMLRRWKRSGWRVERLETQLLAVRVLQARPGRYVLRVRDRVVGGVIDRGGEGRALPASAPVVRTLVLVEQEGVWLVELSRSGRVLGAPRR